jgi:hypothetical protein
MVDLLRYRECEKISQKKWERQRASINGCGLGSRRESMDW